MLQANQSCGSLGKLGAWKGTETQGALRTDGEITGSPGILWSPSKTSQFNWTLQFVICSSLYLGASLDPLTHPVKEGQGLCDWYHCFHFTYGDTEALEQEGQLPRDARPGQGGWQADWTQALG